MWRKQDEPKAPSPPAQSERQNPFRCVTKLPRRIRPCPYSIPPRLPPAGHLTRFLSMKGEITGKDDLFVDGEVHGKIRLHGGKLTIGPGWPRYGRYRGPGSRRARRSHRKHQGPRSSSNRGYRPSVRRDLAHSDFYRGRGEVARAE